MNITAVIFDLDGTLVDSSPGILKAFSGAFSSCGFEPLLPFGPQIIGPPLRETLCLLSGSSEVTLLDNLTEAFKSHYDGDGCLQTLPFPGVDEMLRSLHGSGIRLHIATNKRAFPTGRIIEHLGWRSLFDTVYSLDSFMLQVSNKARLIARLLDDAGLDVSESVYVGDQHEDALAARQNCLPFLWAAWGYGEQRNISCDGEDVLLSPDPERFMTSRRHNVDT